MLNTVRASVAKRRSVGLVAAVCSSLPTMAQPRFVPIGDLPGSLTIGHAFDVSVDGAIVAGLGRPSTSIGAVFEWTEEEGFLELPRLPGGSFYSVSDMSRSGEFFVGAYTDADAGGALSYVWSRDEGIVSIGPLDGQAAPTRLIAVSDSGTAVGQTSVGITPTGAPSVRAARWTTSSGLEVLPLPMPGDEFENSSALSILADDRVYMNTASGRWLYSDADGFELLPEEGQLDFINPAGTFLSGSARFPGDEYERRAVYWTESGGRQVLEPYVDNGELYGVLGMNDDGSVIFGAQGEVGEIVWIDQGPPVLFEDYVASQGVDLGDFSILTVQSVSGDGTTFVGQATAPGDVGIIAYAIVVPSPGTLAVAFGLVVACRRRRRPGS